MRKVVSIICCLITSLILILGILIGVVSIIDRESLGVLFITPCSIALIIIILDLLISIGIIKKGIIYSWISSLLKIGIILLFMPITIYNLREEIIQGSSNLFFCLIVIILLIMTAIPSILNIINLTILKQKQE